jgi:hypothetical protein
VGIRDRGKVVVVLSQLWGPGLWLPHCTLPQAPRENHGGADSGLALDLSGDTDPSSAWASK